MDKIRRLYSDNPLTFKKNQTISYNKEQIKNSGLNKK